MNYIVNFLLELPFAVRVLVGLFIIFGIWAFLGKWILWILSVIPFLLAKIFFLFYQI